MDYKNYVGKMVEAYVEKISKKALFIKHQDVLDGYLDEIIERSCTAKGMETYFHSFSLAEMRDAYEPFLIWIKEIYHKAYSKEYTVEEFLNMCGVYSLQVEIFANYIKEGKCKRKFEVMLEEYDYEKERALESIYACLSYIAKEKKIVFYINKIHLATYSTLHFINEIFNRNDNIRFIFTYGETFLVRFYCKDIWTKLLAKAEDGNMVLSWSATESIQNFDYYDEFIFKEDMLPVYIERLSNMEHFFCSEDAKYYFGIINEYVNRIDTNITDEIKFKLLKIQFCIEMICRNTKDALFVCEKMLPLLSTVGTIEDEFTYNYFSAKAHLLMTESDLTFRFCEKAKKVVSKLNDEFKLMCIEIIEVIARFGSFKELLRCDYTYKIGQDIIDLLKKYNHENALAYMYVFGFDNDDDTINKIGSGEKEPVYFNMGIEIAQRLGNRNLLLVAYMRNIILFSSYGFHNYVRENYKKRIEVLDNSKPTRIAHMYIGLGYNSIAREDYAGADEYLKRGLDILIGENKAEDVAETLYNMVMNFFVAGENEKVVECVELIFKIMDMLHIQALSICNTSKLYGMLGIAYYKLGQYYDCYYCFNKMEMIMSYILNKDFSEIDSNWQEDLFLYHLFYANLLSYEKNYEKALEEFDLAYKYMMALEGVKFYSYPEFAFAKAEFLRKNQDEVGRNAILNEAYEYCVNNNYPLKAEHVKAKINDEEFFYTLKYSKEPLPVKEIINVGAYIGAEVELLLREKDIDFLTLCHEIMVREDSGVLDVIENTMSTIQNSYNFDRMVFIERNDNNRNNLTFTCGTINLKAKDVNEIYEYFDGYKIEFMSSRIDKSFSTHKKILDKFGMNDVTTIVGIPVFNEGVLSKIFIGTVDVHRKFIGNRKLLNKNNLIVLKCAIGQLDEAITRIKNSCMIRVMNSELEKAAVTDQLTGIYNRMGFTKILSEISDVGVVLYMDLDNFKKYNDTYGHNVGDIILKGFANIIKNCVNNIGYPVRYGGDEFVAIIPNVTEAFAKNIANNIGSQLKDDYSIRMAIDGQVISSSIGVAEYDSVDQEGFEQALKLADKALYYVKNIEKGNVALWSEVGMHCTD